MGAVQQPRVKGLCYKNPLLNSLQNPEFLIFPFILFNFRNRLYDLVILDVIMPEIDGFRLYEKIKKLDAKVAICFLTATDDAYYKILKENYPSINENCVIHKPVDNESLLDRIKSVL
jgi:DNA-binding response OmpR family regulator